MKKVGICLNGAVAKLSGSFGKKRQLYTNSQYINVNICYNSIIKHIIEPNTNYSFDFFIHCWNEDLQQKLISIYNPKNFLFENNFIYENEIDNKTKKHTDFAGISKSLSMKKSILLLEEYSKNNEIFYDLVIIYRPDLILFKNIVLDNYDPNNIYVNNHGNGNGDFHFVMNYENVCLFKYLYNSLDIGNIYGVHYWIKNYVINFMKKDLFEDEIFAGKDQEVIRKILTKENKTININKLLPYED